MPDVTFLNTDPSKGDSENDLLGKILQVLNAGGGGAAPGGDVGAAGDSFRTYNGDQYLEVAGQYYLVSAIADQGQIHLDIAQTPTVLP